MTTFNPALMLKVYMQLKTKACQRNRGPADAVPILEFGTVDGKHHILGIGGDGHPVDVLGPAIIEVRAQFGELEWIAMLTDAFGKTAHIDEPRPDLRRGAFAAEHAADPASTTYELLGCNWRHRDGRSGYSSVRYRYIDGPLPVFYPEPSGGIVKGRIAETLKLAFAW